LQAIAPDKNERSHLFEEQGKAFRHATSDRTCKKLPQQTE
jgi:hypothetical protein